MAEPRARPGQAAQHAFRTGVRVAVLGALAALGGLVWFDVVTPPAGMFALVFLFPPYLLVVASILSRWLGLGKDVSDLRQVTRPAGEQHER
jgi:hypothetical protein